MYVLSRTLVLRRDRSFESDSHYDDSELPPNKIPRMDMDERKRFAWRAKEPSLLGRKIDYRVFLLPGAVSAFPYGRLASSSVAYK